MDTLIRLNTSIRDPDLESATEVIFASLATVISSVNSEILENHGRLSPAAKASILKVQESYIDSAIRNSVLLSGLHDLEAYKSFEDQLRSQVGSLYGTMRLPHAGTTRRVPYERLYVQPRIRPLAEDSEEKDGFVVEDVIADTLRMVLLGDPGGGKSTLSLKMTFDCASRAKSDGEASVPFLVILRDYASEISKNTISLKDYIEQQCKVMFSVEPPPNVIDYLLLNGRAFVIFDGLDELLDTALRRRVVDAVTGFATRYPTAPILVTSRKVGYSDASLDPDLFPAFNLCEFSQHQVAVYVENWFELDESISPDRRQGLRDSFLADSAFVEDLRVNPLMLSLMCGIYAAENYIPRNRPDVYEKCALLLFDSWDKQRGIKAPLPFDAHVQAAMRSLALWLYPQQASKGGLSRTKLIGYMKEYLIKKRFDNEEEAENAATQFIDFCKGRAWVLTDVGSDLYGFTHRTFLEYFAASQIVRENTDPSRLFDYLLERLQKGGWEVVAQLAIQILNKSVEDGADNFLDILVTYTEGEIDPALRSRLLEFAAQALTYIVPRPPVLQKLVTHVIRRYHEGQGSEEKYFGSLRILLGASAENLPLVGKYLYDLLWELLKAEPNHPSALFTALYINVMARQGTAWAGVGRNAEFWDQLIRDNFGRFEIVASARKEVDLYVAISMFEYGRCSARDLLDWHGITAILATPAQTPLEKMTVLPLAVRVLVNFFIEGRSITNNGTRVNGEQIEELKEVLFGLRVPWSQEVADEHVFRNITNVLLSHSLYVRKSVGSMSACLLFLMAIRDWENASLYKEKLSQLVLTGNSEDTALLAVKRIVRARDSLLNRTIRGWRAEDAGQVPLNDSSEAEAGLEEIVSSLNVDERTAALIANWTSDPEFRFLGSGDRKP